MKNLALTIGLFLVAAFTMTVSAQDLSIDKAFVIAPIKEAFPLRNNVMAMPLTVFLEQFTGISG